MAMCTRPNTNVLLVGLDSPSGRKYCLKIAAAWGSGCYSQNSKEKESCNQGPIILFLFTCIGYYSLPLTEKDTWSHTPEAQSEALTNQEHLELTNSVCWKGIGCGLPLRSPFLLSLPYWPFGSRLNSPDLELQVALLCRGWRYIGRKTGSWTPRNGEWAVTSRAWEGRLLEWWDWLWQKPNLADCNSPQSLKSAGLSPPVGQCTLHPTGHPGGVHVSGRDPSLPSLSLQDILKYYLTGICLWPSILVIERRGVIIVIKSHMPFSCRRAFVVCRDHVPFWAS